MTLATLPAHWPSSWREALAHATSARQPTPSEDARRTLRDLILAQHQGDDPSQATCDQELHRWAQQIHPHPHPGQTLPERRLSWPVQHHRTTAERWPETTKGPWPAWPRSPRRSGLNSNLTSFSQRALLAYWLALDADPWLPWSAPDDPLIWGWPEALLAHNHVGLLQRCFEHPHRPTADRLRQRRLDITHPLIGRTRIPWLHVAATHSDGQLLQLFLETGLDPQQTDDDGRTALFWAQGRSRALLQAKGLSRTTQDSLGYTATAYQATLGYVPSRPPPTGSELIQTAWGYLHGGHWARLESLLRTHRLAWWEWTQPLPRRPSLPAAGFLAHLALQTLDTPSGTMADHSTALRSLLDRLAQSQPADLATRMAMPGISQAFLLALLVRHAPRPLNATREPVTLTGALGLDGQTSNTCLASLTEHWATWRRWLPLLQRPQRGWILRQHEFTEVLTGTIAQHLDTAASIHVERFWREVMAGLQRAPARIFLVPPLLQALTLWEDRRPMREDRLPFPLRAHLGTRIWQGLADLMAAPDGAQTRAAPLNMQRDLVTPWTATWEQWRHRAPEPLHLVGLPAKAQQRLMLTFPHLRGQSRQRQLECLQTAQPTALRRQRG